MAISVVIPTKDRKLSLQKILPSYLAESEVKEVIIVIDGSTDGTKEFLDLYTKKEPKVRYLKNIKNRGMPYSKNKGIRSAKHDYIFIGEDDLEITEGFFRTLLKHKEQMGFDIISGRTIWRNEYESADESIQRTNLMKGTYVSKKDISTNSNLSLKNDEAQLLLTAPMLAKARVFRQIGFDEIYKVNFWREESDFQLSAQEAGYKLGTCPHAICFNFVINKDRGGAHAAIGMRRVIWVVINDWRFINKHNWFIKENFDIGNRNIYIIKFTIKRIYIDFILPIIIPPLSKIKHYLLKIFR